MTFHKRSVLGARFQSCVAVVGMLLAIAAALVPARALGSACCLSATAFGTGRLLIGEQLAMGMRSAFCWDYGAWTAHAQWQRYQHYAAYTWQTEFWGMVALNRRMDVSLRMPMAFTRWQ